MACGERRGGSSAVSVSFISRSDSESIDSPSASSPAAESPVLIRFEDSDGSSGGL